MMIQLNIPPLAGIPHGSVRMGGAPIIHAQPSSTPNEIGALATQQLKRQSKPSSGERKRILFMAEACTFAHVIRPLVLAKALDPAKYEVHFACARNDLMQDKEFIFEGTDFIHWDITSQSSSQFIAATLNGKRLFDLSTLAAYAEEEIELYNQVRPDFVVGDMRWSLPISAKASGIPHAIIQNAYWSSYAKNRLFPLPEVPAIRVAARMIGDKAASYLFDQARDFVLNSHMQPINQLRKAYDLPVYSDFFTAVSDAEHVLYADFPIMVPTADLPASHRYLGAITWEPDMPPPAWWNSIPTDRPIVYVALGSTGNADLMPDILTALKLREVTVLLAGPESFCSEHVYAAPFFPWNEAAKRSALMIGNGGSGAVYQAIQAEVPLLGIVANQDQLMMMGHVELRECGLMLRASSANTASIGAAVDKLLGDARYQNNAQQLHALVENISTTDNFVRFIDETVAANTTAETIAIARV